MACPHVAGPAALVLAAGKGYVSPSAVMIQLDESAENLYLPPEEQGWGLVDARAAVDDPMDALHVFDGTMDKFCYACGTMEAAVVTVVINDKFGHPVDGLLPEDFVTFIDQNDKGPPPVATTLVFNGRGVGIYVAMADISSLEPDYYGYIVSLSGNEWESLLCRLV